MRYRVKYGILLFLNLQSKKEEEGDDYGDYEEDFEVNLLLLLRTKSLSQKKHIKKK